MLVVLNVEFEWWFPHEGLRYTAPCSNARPSSDWRCKLCINGCDESLASCCRWSAGGHFGLVPFSLSDVLLHPDSYRPRPPLYHLRTFISTTVFSQNKLKLTVVATFKSQMINVLNLNASQIHLTSPDSEHFLSCKCSTFTSTEEVSTLKDAWQTTKTRRRKHICFSVLLIFIETTWRQLEVHC